MTSVTNSGVPASACTPSPDSVIGELTGGFIEDLPFSFIWPDGVPPHAAGIAEHAANGCRSGVSANLSITGGASYNTPPELKARPPPRPRARCLHYRPLTPARRWLSILFKRLKLQGALPLFLALPGAAKPLKKPTARTRPVA